MAHICIFVNPTLFKGDSAAGAPGLAETSGGREEPGCLQHWLGPAHRQVRAVYLHSFFADPDPAVFLMADPDPVAFLMRFRVHLLKICTKLPHDELGWKG